MTNFSAIINSSLFFVHDYSFSTVVVSFIIELNSTWKTLIDWNVMVNQLVITKIFRFFHVRISCRFVHNGEEYPFHRLRTIQKMSQKYNWMKQENAGWMQFIILKFYKNINTLYNFYFSKVFFFIYRVYQKFCDIFSFKNIRLEK